MGEPGPFRGLMYIVLKRLWVGLRLRQRAPHQRQGQRRNRREQLAAAAPQAAAAAPPPQQQQRRGGNGRNNQPRGSRGGGRQNVKFLITLFTALRLLADRVPVLLVLERALIVSLL